MEGIRKKILDLTFKQCLKLLEDDTVAYKRYFMDPDVSKRPPARSENEDVALAASGAFLENVQMGSFPLAHVTRLTRLPALYVANGTETVEGGASARDPALPNVIELFPIVLRLVVNQGVEPAYDESNPIIISQIREQLDYFLDVTVFKQITDKRRGYKIPSSVQSASIVASYNLEGIATPWEVFDFRFEVSFQRQRARDNS